MSDSPYSEDLKDDTDLSLHAGGSVSGGSPGGVSKMVSSDAYAWAFVVGAVAALWFIGRGFRSVNS
jgi:hypothetical protein